MKLLIDIGNTNTSIAILKGKRIKKKYFIYTSKKEVQPKALKRLLGASIKDIDTVLIVSVVPKFLSLILKSLKAVSKNMEIKVIGKNIKVPMKVNYKNPKEVGQDRLVAAFAAVHLFGSPILVVDFGTAVTFDLVSKKGEYEGGLIFPGIRLALESLSSHAALLPKIEVKTPKSLIARDTKSSMNAGVVLGYASMCDGVIKRFKAEYGKKLKVVATGGDAALISRYSTQIKDISKDIIFTGLTLLEDA